MTLSAQNSRLSRLLVVVILLFAACGGGDDDTDTAAPAENSDDTGTGSDEPANDDSSDVEPTTDDVEDVIEEAEDIADDILDSAGGTATVTIADETWEFGLYPQIPMATCNADFFGGFLALLTTEGELTDPLDQMNLTLPGGDFTDPPALRVKATVGGDAEWIAEEAFYERAPDLPAGIGVTSFSIDGQTATGTAMFFEEESFFQFNAGLIDELQMAEGTFRVTCAG